MQIIFKPLHHRGGEQLAIHYPYKREIDLAVRRIKGIKWSRTNRCWYLPLDKTGFETAHTLLKPFGAVDYAEIKEYLARRKRAVTVIHAEAKPAKQAKKSIEAAGILYINETNLQLLDIARV